MNWRDLIIGLVLGGAGGAFGRILYNKLTASKNPKTPIPTGTPPKEK